MKLAGLIVLTVAFVSTLGAGSANAELRIRGYGTADVDGLLTVNEWDGAGRSVFQTQGGQGTFYVMNDSQNLYLALRAPDIQPGASVFDGLFLALPLDFFAPGNDIVHVTPGLFEDLFIHQLTPQTGDYLPDVDDGGTRDGEAAVRTAGGEVVYEIAKPLNNADDRHDFNLTIPSHIQFNGFFQPWLGGGASDLLPGPDSQIVIVSGTRVPPDTRFTFGPKDGAQVPVYGQFGFVGMDDVAPPSELIYECKVDDRDWTACQSPLSRATTDDGWHTVSVRAIDDMLNVDPTPATRRWRIDTRPPSRPKVVVSSLLGGARKQFRISAADRGTPAKRLRFRCSVDGKRFRACTTRLRLLLPAGRHVLRVHAIDPAGNGSDTRVVRFVIR